MEILINNQQAEQDLAGLEKLIAAAFQIAAELEGLEDKLEISVSFVDDQTMKNLNKQYRGIEQSTDVLSFPQGGENGFDYPPELPRMLGDVVICLSRAREQAQEYGHGLEREVLYLAVHGLFHLLGYDHQTAVERQIMRGREEAVLRKLGLGRG